MPLRQRIHEFLEDPAPGDRVARSFHIFIFSLIGLNAIASVLDTVQSVYRVAPRLFEWFYAISVAIFTVEYGLRVWSCTASAKYSSGVLGRLRFAITPLAVVDLLTILPFYLMLLPSWLPFVPPDLRSGRALRLVRVFRVARLTRYSAALRIIGRAFATRRAELLSTLSVLLLLIVIVSSLMYYCENEAQPDRFTSIPATMWWAVTTVTTVGYGDVVPITPRGKLLAMIVAVLGIAVFALPTAILGAAFIEELGRAAGKGKVCPHCGKEIDS